MIIFGKHDGKNEDTFTKNFYEEIRKYAENVSYHPFEYRVFSDGESISRFCDEPKKFYLAEKAIFPCSAKEIRNTIKRDPNIVLVFRGASGYKWNSANDIFSLWVDSKYLKEKMGAKHVTAILPDMGFGKQDKLFYDHITGELLDGSPITVDEARELLHQWIDLLISFNVHDFRYKTGWIKKDETTIPGATKGVNGSILDERGRVILQNAVDWTNFAYSIDAMPLLIKYVVNLSSNLLFIGPDRSVENIIRKYSNRPLIADKIRDRRESLDTKSTIELPDDMTCYDVALIDDRIDAGNTLNNIAKMVGTHARPPRSIICGAVNGRLVYNDKLKKSALDILRGESGTRVIVTNTVDTPVSEVHVESLLAEELYRLTN